MNQRPLPLHPLLVASYLAVAAADNAAETYWGAIWPSLVGLLLLGVVVWGGATLLVRDARKSALIASLFLLQFFLFAFPCEIVCGPPHLPAGDGLPGPILFLVFWGCLFIGLSWAVGRTRRDLNPVTSIANVFAAVLLVMATGSVVYSLASSTKPRHNGPVIGPSAPPGSPTSGETPDIYYIVLDGYTRQDVLKQRYGFDNRPFLDALRQRGFYVAEKSRSNYCRTLLSLSSSLNMTYLEEMGKQSENETRYEEALTYTISNSALVRFLRPRGYQFVAIWGEYDAVKATGADVFLEGGWTPSRCRDRLIADSPLALLPYSLLLRYEEHRHRLQGEISLLSGIAADARSPKFVFVHILAPHPPFVFGPNGERVTPDRPFSISDGQNFRAEGGTEPEYRAGYRGQVAFINRQILGALDAIQKNSQRPPIIVLQGDHGARVGIDFDSLEQSDLSEAWSILNAYSVPEATRARLYPEITPVNSFRLILDTTFGAEYLLLPDRSYYSTVTRPWNFTEVTDRLPKEKRADKK